MIYAAPTSSQIYRLAAEARNELSTADRSRLSADQLFALALTGCLELSRLDRDRLRSLHLAHLAVMEKIDLDTGERARLPADVLFELVDRGYTSLPAEELNRFTPHQREAIVERDANAPLGLRMVQ